MKQLKKSRRPVVLTVKGQAAAVVQDAAAWQKLPDIAALTDANEGIRQGLEDSRQGKARSAAGVPGEFRSRARPTSLASRPGRNGTFFACMRKLKWPLATRTATKQHPSTQVIVDSDPGSIWL